MKACTFFGHRECPVAIKPALREAIESMIIRQEVGVFYVGNQGQFDAYVRSILQHLQAEYPQLRYGVVLAYLPQKLREYDNATDTMFPEGLENTHPRYAVDRRNRWMLERSEFVICYVRYTWGGAYKFMQLAKKTGKRVLNLAEHETLCANQKNL